MDLVITHGGHDYYVSQLFQRNFNCAYWLRHAQPNSNSDMQIPVAEHLFQSYEVTMLGSTIKQLITN